MREAIEDRQTENISLFMLAVIEFEGVSYGIDSYWIHETLEAPKDIRFITV